MQIAVACDGLDISANAPRCSSFMCYTADNGVLTNCRNLPNMGLTSHEEATLLIDLGFDTFISGSIDTDLADELCEAGIKIVEGAKGTPREAVDAYLSDTLEGDLAGDSMGDLVEDLAGDSMGDLVEDLAGDS